MPKQLISIVLVVAVSIIFRLGRAHLVDMKNPMLNAWPSQVIFGLYFVILTLAIQGLEMLRKEERFNPRRQALLLLSLVGVCLDLVLVNVKEINESVDASYGPVVIWDVATFFVWLRVVDLCRPENHEKFRESWAVMIAPLFALGREILFLPYTTGDVALSYFDLIFGNVLTSLWVFVPFVNYSTAHEHSRRKSLAERTLLILIFTGCAYWFVSASEHCVALAWAPFNSIDGVFRITGVPFSLLNCFNFVLAVTITFTFWHWDFLDLASFFGISRAKAVRHSMSQAH